MYMCIGEWGGSPRCHGIQTANVLAPVYYTATNTVRSKKMFPSVNESRRCTKPEKVAMASTLQTDSRRRWIL